MNVDYSLTITINDNTTEIHGTSSSHFKNEENALKYVRREINRFIKSKLETGTIYEED